jgi:WD40 repeat protein/ribosomal protein S25
VVGYDTGDNPDQLPILQHALMRTWNYWKEHRSKTAEVIDLPHYDAIGGMLKALSNHANEIYERIPTEKREVAETLFKRLTDKGLDGRGIRLPSKLKELCAVANATQAEVVEIVDQFRAPGCSFLMPPLQLPLTGETTLDISHESLMRIWDRLQKWVQQESQSAQTYRRLAESANLYQEGKADLCRDPELTIALNWYQENHPNKAWAERYDKHFDQVNDYLNKSKEEYNSEIAKQKEIEQEELDRTRKEVENQKRINQQQLVSGAAIIFSIIAIGLGFSSFFIAQIALKNNTKLLSQSSNVLYEERPQQLDALEYALNATQSLERELFSWLSFNDLEIKDQVLGKLIQSAYGVREFNRLEGHDAPVNSISFSSDGKYIASAGDDNSIILWDREKGSFIPFPGHSNRVNSVSFSPDGKNLASGSDDNKIKIWDLNGKARDLPKKQKKSITSVSYSPDGKMLASASDDNSVVLWKENNGTFIFVTSFSHGGSRGRVKAVSFSPDGKSLASAGWDNVIKLWDINGKSIKTKDLNSESNKIQESQESTTGDKKKLTSISFSSDGKKIAVGSLDKSITLWDLKNDTVKKFNEHSDRVMSVSFSPDNQYLASASADNTAKIWDLNTEKVVETLNIKGITSINFASDSTLATTDLYKKIRLWKLPSVFSESPVHSQLAPVTINVTKSYINSIDVSPDGKIIAIASGGTESDGSKSIGEIVLYNLQTKALIIPSQLRCGGKLRIKFSPVNSSIVVISENCLPLLATKAAKKSIVKVWDLKLRKSISELEVKGDINAIDFSLNGENIAISINQSGSTPLSQIMLWNWHNNFRTSFSINKSIEVNIIDFRPGHDELVIGSVNGRIYLTDLKGKITEPFKEYKDQHTSGITSLQATSNGLNLISSGYDTTIRLWNLENSKKNKIIGSHGTSINSISLSKNERWIASASEDGVIKIWSLVDSKSSLLSTLEWSNKLISNLRFSPDQRALITTSGSKILIWNIDLVTLKNQGCNFLSSQLKHEESVKYCLK